MAIWPFGRSKRSKNARNAAAKQQSGVLDEKDVVTEERPSTSTARRGARATKISPSAAKTSNSDTQTFSRDRSRARSQLEVHEDDLPFGTTTIITGSAHHPKSSTVLPITPILRPKPRTPKVKNATASPEASRRPLKELENPAAPRSEALESRTSLHDDEDFTAIPIIPTLRPYEKLKSPDSQLFRRKSSKGKAGEKQRREEEKQRLQRLEDLKTVSRSSPIPIPKRPTSDAGGLMVRESMRSPNWTRRPNSEISLPLPASLEDSVPDHQSENTSYKLTTFDILYPRPTIRYNSHPRYLRSAHGKDKDPVLPEADVDWSSRARMNELADGLDASGLRELMDRDRRRRDRKRKVDAQKLARKLERKAQREEEAKKLKSKGKGKDKEAGSAKGLVDEQDDAGLAVLAAAAAKVAQDEPEQVVQDTPAPIADRDETDRWLRQSKVSRLSTWSSKNSLDSPVSPISHESQSASPFQERDEDVLIETAQTVHYSQANLSPPTSPVLPRQIEQATQPELKAVPTPYVPVVAAASPQPDHDVRRDSQTSSRKGHGWASIFRRGQKESRTSSEKGRATPSESGFSNASRESFARSGPSAAAEASFVRTGGGGGPQHTIIPQKSFRKAGTPQRTRSKFREELPASIGGVPAVPPVPHPTRQTTPPPPVPERSTGRPQSPRSPSQSRVASPEAGSGPPSPFVDNPNMLSTDAAINAPMEDVHPALRGDVVLSRGPSVHGSHRNSGAAATAAAASAALLSQSLASVDSEGSWLSGRRPSKRSSITGRPSSNSIGGGYTEDEGRAAATGSPLMFGRRAGSPTRSGSGAGASPPMGASSSISTQLRALRNQSQTGEPTAEERRPSSTPEGSVVPTPVRLSALATNPDQHGDDAGAVLHTVTVARSPTIVQRAEATRSREGILDIYDPQPSSAIVESGESPGSQEGEAQPSPEGLAEAEQAEIKRATSVKLKGDRGHARQVSAGSARLLDISKRASGDASKLVDARRSSAGSLSKMNELSTIETKDSGRGSRLAQATSAEQDEEDGRRDTAAEAAEGT